jgi:hypothetical protein
LTTGVYRIGKSRSETLAVYGFLLSLLVGIVSVFVKLNDMSVNVEHRFTKIEATLDSTRRLENRIDELERRINAREVQVAIPPRR